MASQMSYGHPVRRPALAILLAAGALSCGGTPGSPAKEPQAGGGEGAPADQASAWHARMDAFRRLAEAQAPPPADDVIWKAVAAGAPSRGSLVAKVTIVEFGDYQCPFCTKAEDAMKQVLAAFGDSVRVVWRDAPLAFHEHALAAAELAREARAEKGEAGFWAAHDALLERKGRGGDLSDEGLSQIGQSLGLDAAAVTSALASAKYMDAIEDDEALADDIGVEGTPTFFVNGRKVVGALPFEELRPLVAEEIAHADALLKTGAPPASLYDILIKDGRTSPLPRAVDVPVPKGAPVKGDPGAPVVIQEFADFQCPYCLRAEGSLRRVFAHYGTKVKLVWRHLPLPMHPLAEAAAEAAVEAGAQKGNAGFWQMHDKLLLGQALPHGLERAALASYAKDVGMDGAAFEKALDRHAHAATVTTDAKMAASVDFSGTPVFVVGRYVLEGAQPYIKFKKLVDRALVEAGAAP